MSYSMSNRVRSVLFFRDGSIAAFDENGEQIPQLQMKTVMEPVPRLRRKE